MAPSRKAAAKKAAAAAGGGGVAAAPAGKTKVAKADWSSDLGKKKSAGVSDMTLLSTITNDAINENLKKRFENAEIYTYIGHVLISVNPFRLLPIYDTQTLLSYRNKNRLEVPPHVYSIAESAFYNMTSYGENQCVIISGESGAGKTEAAKRIMQYIAEVAGAEGSSSGSGITQIKEMVLATNPLLESFGCAKTLRNNNSSRHGKYLEIQFNSRGEPVGATVTNYLLEKGRVVGQVTDERNFHIFYQFTKSASPAQQEAFGLQGPDAYAYTSRSGCLDVPGIDDVADWAETIRAMETIGLSADEQNDILRQLATILWLGNVQFAEGDDGAHIADSSVPEFVAYLMEVDAAAVNKALTIRVMETQRGGRRGSVYEVPLNAAQAASTRDALAKAIYNNLFEWIVARVNIALAPPQPAAVDRIIGVLDIYGFEIFQSNSFEQLCINYVNEKLQQIFIELTLKTEQEEYVREQIKWTPIDYFNNKVVCDLIEEKRPPGVFAALNDACATAHADPTAADSSFVQRLNFLSSNAHFEGRGNKFIIKHYAGDVTYDIDGMTDKNKDVLNKDLLDLIGSSGNQYLQALFPDRPDPNSKKRPPTAGDRIKLSANALVDKLMASQPSYIRTIKPNQNKSPSEYDTKAILHQIKYLGLQENIRVRRAGFAYRNTFEKMVERFYLLSPATSYAGEYIWQGDAKSGCERILRDTGIADGEWQMGTTKAFIKNPETLFALEHLRDRYWHNMAARIQRSWRAFLRYRNECATRVQQFWQQKKKGIKLAQMRDYGHQVLAGRKERRRYSLLSMRQFQGDYLGIRGLGPVGQAIGTAAGLTPAEDVAFSSRVQLLVSKLARSSKPSPRFLILTDLALYFVITEQGPDGKAVSRTERRIPLSIIKGVGLSTLRDDWVTLDVQSLEEPDPVFSCLFKTEFVAHLLQRTGGNVSVTVAPQLDYKKKKDKKATITFTKNEQFQNDVYKSHNVSVASGEAPTSVSAPPARRKPGIVRPITSGKLLRPGGPSDKPAPASRPIPKSRPLPSGAAASVPKAPPGAAVSVPGARATPAPAAGRAQPVAAAAAASAVKRTPPAPPRPPSAPPVPEVPEVPLWRAVFDFATTESGEMSLTKDEIVEVVQKDDNGWWLIKKGNAEGWAPSTYLKEEPPKPKAPAAAPPPVRRAPPAAPAAAPKPAASTNGGASNIAAAIAARAGATNGSAAPRPVSGIGKPAPAPAPKPVAPAVKPKPGAPPAAAKPSIPGRPPVPSAARPTAPPAPPRPGGAGAAKPAGAPGQMDLAAALAKRAGRG